MEWATYIHARYIQVMADPHTALGAVPKTPLAGVTLQSRP
jgi:hypothetical protein